MNKKMLHPTLPALLASVISTAAFAADDPALYLGPSFYQREGPYQADTVKSLLPTGDYEGERLLIRGDTLGLRLFTQEKLTFNAIVLSDQLSFNASAADSAALRLLDDRKESLNGGIEASWKITPQDTFRVALMGDVANRHQSTLESVHAEHVFALEKTYTQIVPRLNWTYFQKGFGDYYFGISRNESQRSGIAEYHPGASSRLDAGLTLAQPLSRDLVIFVDGVWKRFSSNISDSPMLDRRTYVELSAGVLYNFRAFF